MKRPTPFYGHEIGWSHFTTPRNCRDFYPDMDKGDKWVWRVSIAILTVLIALLALGQFQ